MNAKDLSKLMKYLEKMNLAAWMLRLGLAFVFLYASISQMRSPNDWIGYIPTQLGMHIDVMTVLKLTELGEFVLALWVLSGFYVRYAALASALVLAGIVATNISQLIVTFRDVGLMFAALALAFLPERAPSSERPKHSSDK